MRDVIHQDLESVHIALRLLLNQGRYRLETLSVHLLEDHRIHKQRSGELRRVRVTLVLPKLQASRSEPDSD